MYKILYTQNRIVYDELSKFLSKSMYDIDKDETNRILFIVKKDYAGELGLEFKDNSKSYALKLFHFLLDITSCKFIYLKAKKIIPVKIPKDVSIKEAEKLKSVINKVIKESGLYIQIDVELPECPKPVEVLRTNPMRPCVLIVRGDVVENIDKLYALVMDHCGVNASSLDQIVTCNTSKKMIIESTFKSLNSIVQYFESSDMDHNLTFTIE